MNELELIKNIENIIGNEYIGDDCAYLKEIGIVVSQDSLVEGIHFRRDWCTPFQLGYKSIIVNISDILASGAEPKYLTIGLSLPDNVGENFVKDFYSGINNALHGVKVIGGDITGSENKIFISVCAIGIDKGRNISSRKNAKNGYIIITKGNFGSSAAGLNELITGGNNKDLILSHLEPRLEYDFSKSISTLVTEPYAMMDSSDGLADALFKIAEASNLKAVVDFDSIPNINNLNKDYILFGGEDYKLIAAIPEKYSEHIKDSVIIGKMLPYDGVRLDISGQKYKNYSELKVFNHFGEKHG